MIVDYSKNLKPVEIEVLPNGRLNVKNAAKYLDLSKKTLAMKRSQGIGPKFHKNGGVVSYYVNELEEWLHQGKAVISTAQARRLKADQNSLAA
jgi:hypothetical protein